MLPGSAGRGRVRNGLVGFGAWNLLAPFWGALTGPAGSATLDLLVHAVFAGGATRTVGLLMPPGGKAVTYPPRAVALGADEVTADTVVRMDRRTTVTAAWRDVALLDPLDPTPLTTMLRVGRGETGSRVGRRLGRDLGCDEHTAAEVIEFYRRHPELRAELEDGRAVDRIARDDFPAPAI